MGGRTWLSSDSYLTEPIKTATEARSLITFYKNKEEPAGLVRLLLSRFNYLFMRALRPIIANQTQGRGIKNGMLVSFYLFTLFTQLFYFSYTNKTSHNLRCLILMS